MNCQVRLQHRHVLPLIRKWTVSCATLHCSCAQTRTRTRTANNDNREKTTTMMIRSRWASSFAVFSLVSPRALLSQRSTRTLISNVGQERWIRSGLSTTNLCLFSPHQMRSMGSYESIMFVPLKLVLKRVANKLGINVIRLNLIE